jgi:cystathionine beta-lyase
MWPTAYLREREAVVYDFESIIDRRGTSSEKWNLISQDMGPGNDDVIALSVADMEFKPAPEIVDALVDSARNDIFGYDYVTDAYYDAVVGWMRRRHGYELRKEWISVSDGVMPAINTALRAFTRPGDRVIIQEPVYYPFMSAASHNGLTLLNNQLVRDPQGRYRMDYEDLERKAADPRCKAIIVCNPHNPVGRVWDEDELRRLGDICIENGVIVLCDDIHADFTYPGHETVLFGSLGERYAGHCIDFTAPTKTFNLAGLLCSNAIIADESMKRDYDAAAQNIGGLTVSHAGMVACQAAYDHAEPWLDELGVVIRRNRDVVEDFTEGRSVDLVRPEGTYLAWLDCRRLGFDSDGLRDFMRSKARIYCDEGALFGMSGRGFERVNLACPTRMLERALGSLSEALAAV